MNKKEMIFFALDELINKWEHLGSPIGNDWYILRDDYK